MLAEKYIKTTLLTLAILTFTSLVQAALSGDYEVGDPGDPFPTINDAVAALNSEGISGPVDFILSSGIYDEQVTIEDFTRSGSPDDEVTFRKSFGFSSVTWQYTSADSAATNFAIKLAGASHITIRGIAFKSGEAPYGGLVVLADDTANITITDASFTGLAVTDSTLGSMISQSGTGGGRDIELLRNIFIDGYRAIDLDLQGSQLQGLLVTRNTFSGQQDAAIVSGSSGIMVNNMVSGTGSGMDISGSNMSIYHNTVSVRGSQSDPALRVSGTATQIRIRNNILTHDGSGGLALEIASGVMIESSDYNNIFSAGSVPLVRDGSFDYNTLAAYQAAQGLDTNSVSVAVSYRSESEPYNLHLTAPSSSSAELAAASLVDVAGDFDNHTRFTPFTFMGADEGIEEPSVPEPIIFRDSFELSHESLQRKLESIF